MKARLLLGSTLALAAAPLLLAAGACGGPNNDSGSAPSPSGSGEPRACAPPSCPAGETVDPVLCACVARSSPDGSTETPGAPRGHTPTRPSSAPSAPSAPATSGAPESSAAAGATPAPPQLDAGAAAIPATTSHATIPAAPTPAAQPDAGAAQPPGTSLVLDAGFPALDGSLPQFWDASALFDVSTPPWPDVALPPVPDASLPPLPDGSFPPLPFDGGPPPPPDASPPPPPDVAPPPLPFDGGAPPFPDASVFWPYDAPFYPSFDASALQPFTLTPVPLVTPGQPQGT